MNKYLIQMKDYYRGRLVKDGFDNSIVQGAMDEMDRLWGLMTPRQQAHVYVNYVWNRDIYYVRAKMYILAAIYDFEQTKRWGS